MGKYSPLSGKGSSLSGKHPLVLCLCLGLAALDPARAQARSGAASTTVPTHLNILEQNFDDSVGGLRQYLQSLQPTNPALYAQLDPDLKRLEERSAQGVQMLLAGLGLGIASGVAAVLTHRDCQDPSVFDPNFAARMQEWGACNEHNLNLIATFSLLGMAAIIAGGVAAAATMPGRADRIAFMNKHNRLSTQPLRLEVGYQPESRFAFGGATLTF
jgi:hypothetical protein